MTNREPESERFLQAWSPRIDAWVRRALGPGASTADVDDLRQSAHLAAWEGFIEWRDLAEDKRDHVTLDGIVGSKVKDAVLDQRAHLRQRPRKGQRGSGLRAELLRDYLSTLVGTSRAAYARRRADLLAQCMTEYHLQLAGILHSQTGLVSAERALLREEVLDRIMYALERISDEERALIDGVFYAGRTLDEIGAELGISRPAATRLKKRVLSEMRRWMDEFASALGPHNTGGTLDDEPFGGSSIA